MPAKKVNTQKYPVLQPIAYHGPDKPYSETTVTPDMEIAEKGLTFPHLSESEIKLLQTRRILGNPIK